MYAQILTALGLRKSSTNLQMSAEFKNHIEQVSVMVIVNERVYFLLYPYIIYPVGVSFLFIDLITLRYWELAAILSYEVNASINPLLYYLSNEQYRCAVKAMFRGCFKTVKNQNNTQLDSSKIVSISYRKVSSQILLILYKTDP